MLGLTHGLGYGHSSTRERLALSILYREHERAGTVHRTTGARRVQITQSHDRKKISYLPARQERKALEKRNPV